jgi:hypothetical protein
MEGTDATHIIFRIGLAKEEKIEVAIIENLPQINGDINGTLVYIIFSAFDSITKMYGSDNKYIMTIKTQVRTITLRMPTNEREKTINGNHVKTDNIYNFEEH